MNMSEITKTIGQRIRNYRVNKGLSQEKLAELCGCHYTYVGQIERGEKNATVESLERLARALEIPLSRLFENLGGKEEKGESRNIPLECYEFLLSKKPAEQEYLFNIMKDMDKYKNN